MRVLVAGSRSITDKRVVADAIEASGFDIGVLISGGAKGVDQGGEDWARRHEIPIELYLPDWEKHGRSAGFKRNMVMVDKADAVIAVWDGESRGTLNTMTLAKSKNIPLFVWSTRKES